MPHIGSGTEENALIKISEWNGFSLSVSRQCLRPSSNSTYQLVLYVSSILNQNVPKVSPSLGPNGSDYLMIPIKSNYLTQLAAARDEFKAQTAHLPSGAGYINIFEQMRSQIFRVFEYDYPKFFRESNLDEIKDPELVPLLANLQYHPCSFGRLSSQKTTPKPSERYQAIIDSRSHGNKNQHLACYIYTDLIQFKGELNLTPEQLDTLKRHEQPFTETQVIRYRAQSHPDANVTEAMRLWGNDLTKQSDQHLSSLEERVTELESAGGTMAITAEYMASNILTHSESDYENTIMHLNLWTLLPLIGVKTAAGQAKQILAYAWHGLSRLTKQLTPLEEGGVSEIPAASITVAGNASVSAPTEADPNHKVLKFFNEKPPPRNTKVHQTTFSYLASYEVKESDTTPLHPFHVLPSGSFLLFDGQPIAVLSVINQDKRERLALSAKITSLNRRPVDQTQPINPTQSLVTNPEGQGHTHKLPPGTLPLNPGETGPGQELVTQPPAEPNSPESQQQLAAANGLQVVNGTLPGTSQQQDPVPEVPANPANNTNPAVQQGTFFGLSALRAGAGRNDDLDEDSGELSCE